MFAEERSIQMFIRKRPMPFRCRYSCSWEPLDDLRRAIRIIPVQHPMMNATIMLSQSIYSSATFNLSAAVPEFFKRGEVFFMINWIHDNHNLHFLWLQGNNSSALNLHGMILTFKIHEIYPFIFQGFIFLFKGFITQLFIRLSKYVIKLNPRKQIKKGI